MKKRMGLGFRGSIMTFAAALSMVVYTAFNNFPQNIVGPAFAEAYGWNTAIISILFTVGMLLCVAVQFIITKKVGQGRLVKKLTMITGIISLVISLGLMFFKDQTAWLICYVLFMLFCGLWVTVFNSMLIGQWFPRRKGTVMGIATMAYPITTGFLMALFQTLFNKFGIEIAYLPFLIFGIISLVLSAVFVSDYPEEVGCYRDNDPSMTKEEAMALMQQELEAKKNSVWTRKRILSCKEFWCFALVDGFMMFIAVGLVVQFVPMLISMDPAFFAAKGSLVMMGYSICAAAGSWIMGIIDTKIGTKKAMLISTILIVIAGVVGLAQTVPAVLVALYINAIFMGAASNFMVSSSAEFWRREDFGNIFMMTCGVSNLINALGPAVMAIIFASLGYRFGFGFITVAGIVTVILMLLANPKHVKELDEKYRAMKQSEM